MIKPKIPSKKFWDDDRWAHDNYQVLLKGYANKWIAVLNHKVVIAHSDLKEVKKFLCRKLKNKAVPLLHIEDAAHVY